MTTFTYTIQDEVGIHARPAGLLVQEAKKCAPATITIQLGEKSAVATKLLAIMALGVKHGDTVTVTVEGDNEAEAAKAIEEFFKANL